MRLLFVIRRRRSSDQVFIFTSDDLIRHDLKHLLWKNNPGGGGGGHCEIGLN